MTYFTTRAKNLLLASIIALIVTYIVFPSLFSSILPSAIILFLAVHTFMFKPKISLTTYLKPDSVFFDNYAEVYVKVKGSRGYYVEIYDEPPRSIRIVKGEPYFKGTISSNGIVEFRYIVQPLSLGLHTWGKVIIYVEDGLRLIGVRLSYENSKQLHVHIHEEYFKEAERKIEAKTKHLKEHYEPLFEKVRPYMPGDSLRTLVPKSIAMPGGLRVKSFVSESPGKGKTSISLTIIPLVSYEMRQLHKTCYILIYAICKLIKYYYMKGYYINLVLNGQILQIKTLRDLERIKVEDLFLNIDKFSAFSSKIENPIIISDAYTYFKTISSFRKIKGLKSLIILPDIDNLELLLSFKSYRKFIENNIKNGYLNMVRIFENMPHVEIVHDIKDLDKIYEVTL